MTSATTPVAGWLFVAVVLISLGATLVAARRGGGQEEFFTAGGRIGGVANGIAISAEFTSAASLLGVIGLFYGFGGDAMIYLLSTCVGFAFVLFTMAERYRAIGTVTIADVLTNRFCDPRLRMFAAVSSLVVVGFYLISQLVSGAHLLGTLFDMNYALAVIALCILVLLFVTIGGMLATTWVQMFKAGIFVCGLVGLSVAVLAMVDFDFGLLLDRAAAKHRLGPDYMQPGAMLPDVAATLSLGISLAFGVAGLPHILIRFCTVRDAAAARVSMLTATLIVCLVVATYFILALATVMLIAPDQASAAPGGANMIFLALVHTLGGEILLGVVCAAIFATILAVVAGLLIAAISALSRDLFGRGSDGGSAMRTRLCTLAIVIVGGLLALAFEHQNIGFTMSLAFAVAASANFPILFLALHWTRLTADGALIGGIVGLGSALVLVVLGPTVWVDTLGFSRPVYPYREPALLTVPLAFMAAWLGSMLPTILIERTSQEAP